MGSSHLFPFPEAGPGWITAVAGRCPTFGSMPGCPSSLRLLGDWNWYLPRWLHWLPEIHIEGQADDVIVEIDLTDEVPVPELV